MCCVMPPASRLGHLGLADGVEERRLAVVDVTHHGDDRRARDHVFRARLFAFGRHQLLLEAAHLDLRRRTPWRCPWRLSMSSVLLMVIIMRFINSLARTSFTRTSSLSARSFTVMPSARVIVRVMGGGAAGALGIDGARRPFATRLRRPLTRSMLQNGGRCRTAGAALEAAAGRACRSCLLRCLGTHRL
jgi:hypothetical protein